MDVFKLEIAQMLKNHPILHEKDYYKCKYINILEYFVRKFSLEDEWANATLQLYKKALLNDFQKYSYRDFKLTKQAKSVVSTRFKFFKFFSYRYCVIVDCMFINAINDKIKGKKIFDELIAIYHKRHHKNIQRVFDGLYDVSISLIKFEQIDYLVDCWIKNQEHLLQKPIQVIVTATMSAGKSTLINALVGKKVSRTQNDVCTAKIHYIRSKPFEDGYCYEKDFSLELDAKLQTLMNDNINNTENIIDVGSFFRTVGNDTKRIWLIDTPGVNSSQNKIHKKITERCIKETKADILLYLLNGENIGSDDDRSHLQFVLKNYKGKIIFVVNKLDKFRKKEDSVEKTLFFVLSDLKKIGFLDPIVVPLSSIAAYLAKLSIFGEILDEEDKDDFDRMARKLKKNEYQFNTYYPSFAKDENNFNNLADNYQLLLHSGILQLENIIYRMRG